MTLTGMLHPEFWPVVSRLSAVVGICAVLILVTRRWPSGSADDAAARAQRAAGHASMWPRFYVWCAIIAGMAVIIGLGGAVFAAGMLVVGVFAFRELYAALRRGFEPFVEGNGAAACAALAWVGAPLVLLVLLRNQPNGFGVVCWVFIVVAFSDIFAMFGGLIAGRTRFMPSMSPAKTVEGLIAGVAGGLGGALMIRFALPDSGLTAYLFASFVLIVAGIVGDLAASAVKRRVGLKDFGSALPGHGGVMDRLDSTLAAAPVAYVLATFGIVA